MKKQIPCIPKQSIDFRRMQYTYSESETSSMVVTRADFMRLLEQQPVRWRRSTSTVMADTSI